MKVFHEKDYEYIGQKEGWHCFRSIKKDFDPEIVLVYRARFIKKNGTSVYYDPINVETAMMLRVQEYRKRLQDMQTSMCVIDPAKVKRKPKWKVEEINESFMFVQVSPKA